MNLQIHAKYGGAEKRKWVVWGGSYPGALVAWFRSLYPNYAVAAWSSSGVINAIEDFENFYYDIYEATSKSGADCPTRIQTITTYIENIFKQHD